MATQDDTFSALVLLDRNMPVLNGWETLAVIKESDDLRYFPIVILTTSSIHGQKCSAIDMHAAGYFTKLADCRRLVDITEALNLCWVKTNGRETTTPLRHLWTRQSQGWHVSPSV
jgi:CheY-like chemotaxis protein